LSRYRDDRAGGVTKAVVAGRTDEKPRQTAVWPGVPMTSICACSDWGHEDLERNLRRLCEPGQDSVRGGAKYNIVGIAAVGHREYLRTVG
jgi:hypothetical protein